MTRRIAIGGALLVAVVVVLFVVTRGDSEPAAAPEPADSLTLGQLVGQRLITGYIGVKPTSSVIDAVRKGKVGGVILYADNTPDAHATARAVRRLQKAARTGKQPHLLVIVDQEGGYVKRLSWAPPKRSPAQVGKAANPFRAARSEGVATARALKRAGINVDLAPVADVPATNHSFLATRAYSRDPHTVAAAACGFAEGLAKPAGVAAALKHFPGLGHAGADTDRGAVEVDASAREIDADLAAYRRCPDRVALVMLANASFPRIGIGLPASMSPKTYKLLAQTGFNGLTITDAYDTPALTGYKNAERRAIQAGADLLMFGQITSNATGAYGRLLADVRAGRVRASSLRAGANEILAEKSRLAEAGL